MAGSPNCASPGATTRASRSAVLIVGAVGVAVVAATAIIYSQRGPIGTRLAIDYLQRRGVPASITIERLGPGGFVGSARLGPANDPDLTIDRIEVEFSPLPILSDGIVPRVRSVRMVRPRLKARYVPSSEACVRAALMGWGVGVVPELQVRTLAGLPMPHDSALVQRWRAAGLLVLGRTNTPEFGLTPYTEPLARPYTGQIRMLRSDDGGRSFKALRAGLPQGWRAGDKTGTGLDEGVPDRINDVAIFWPPGHAPVVVACCRTAIGRAHAERGVFRRVRGDELAAAVVRAAVDRSGVDPATRTLS